VGVDGGRVELDIIKVVLNGFGPEDDFERIGRDRRTAEIESGGGDETIVKGGVVRLGGGCQESGAGVEAHREIVSVIVDIFAIADEDRERVERISGEVGGQGLADDSAVGVGDVFAIDLGQSGGVVESVAGIMRIEDAAGLNWREIPA